MLGALAKTFGRGAGPALSVEEEVEQLLSRVSESKIPEERTEALSQLRDIAFDSIEAQLALANLGIPVLVSVVRDDRGEPALLRGAVECLHVCMAQPSRSTKGDQESSACWVLALGNGAFASCNNLVLLQATPAHTINAEMFTRSKDHLLMLLALFEQQPPDFYVRYHALRTLGALMHAAPFRTQEAVLSGSHAVSHMVALLREEEVLRNEALMLLSSIAANSPDLQQLIAFEGAFDGAWTAIDGEGGVEGGGTVQDALELLCTLLLGNTKTQLMFRDMGHIPRLASLLKPGLAAAAADHLGRQEQLNLQAALMLTQILLTPLDSTRELPTASPSRGVEAAQNLVAAQALLLKEGVLEPLVIAGISRATSHDIRAKALQAAALAVAANTTCQDKLAALTVTAAVGQIPIVQAVLRVSLYGQEEGGRAAAKQLLRSFCAGNKEGQLALVSTMVPLGNENADASSFGSELIKALMSSDLDVSSRAAGLTSLLLEGNPDAKERALTIPLSVHAAPGNFLMPRTMTYLQAVLSSQGDRPGLAVAAPNLLCLLVLWCHQCPPAVTSFFSTAAHVPCLVDVIQGRLGSPHPLTVGLAALLMGVLLLYGRASETSGLRETLSSRVGVSDLLAKLAAMREDPLWEEAIRPKQVDLHQSQQQDVKKSAPVQLPTPLDSSFIQLVDEFEPQLQEALLAVPTQTTSAGGPVASLAPGAPASGPGPSLGNGLAGASGNAAALGFNADWPHSALTTVQTLRREVEELKIRNTSLTQDLARLSSASPGPSAASSATLAAVQGKVEGLQAQLAQTQQQRDDLQGEVGRLRQQVVGCREEVRLSRDEAEKYTRDLEDLSAAYNQLEAHSLQVESKLRDTEARLEVAQQASAAPVHAAPGVGGVSQQEVDRLVEAAKEQARAEAEADNEEGMNDLLVCLGQEEAKVERLRCRLEELGEDVDQLLEGIGMEEEGDEGDEGLAKLWQRSTHEKHDKVDVAELHSTR